MTDGIKYVGTREHLYDDPPTFPNGKVDHWKQFVQKNEKLDKLEKDHTNKLANKIVDKHYQQNKNKSPFTQVAENAVKELEFKYNSTTGTFRNNDGKTLPMKEALEATEALDKNFQDHKTGDYLAKYNSHPKLEKMPLLNRNINNRKSTGVKTNPTVERYKHFKEDKKFKDDFEKEYGEQAIKNYVRAKVNKNRREGKADYENLSSSDLIVGEYAKEDAKKKLAAITAEHKKIEPTYIDYRLALKEPEPTISLEEHIARRVPIAIDPLGITGLEEVKNFKNLIDITDKKFPKEARGIGPYLSGEDS